MKKLILGTILGLGLVLVAAPRQAQACGGGSGGGAIALLIMGGTVAAGADVTFSVLDLAFVSQGNRPNLPYGVAELLVAAPQAGLFGWWTVATMQGGSNDATLPAALTLWTAGLAAHGIYSIVRAGSPREAEPPRHAAVDWRVAPAMVSAGQARAAPGAVIFGRF